MTGILVSTAAGGLTEVNGVGIGSNAPHAEATGSLQSAGDAVTLAVDGWSAVGLQLVANAAWTGGAVAFVASQDGGQSYPIALSLTPFGGGPAVTGATAAGNWECEAGAITHVRVVATAAISGGPVAVTLMATTGLRRVQVGAPATSPLPVAQVGSTGTDFSANRPTLPVVGASFATSGPYAGYVLVATLPANPLRANVDVENISGAQVAVVRDDGTAASGAAPTNASVFALAGGTAAGAQGGSWSSQTFKGRLQVYAPSATAIVAVMQD